MPDTTRIAPKEFWELIGDDDLPKALKNSTQLVCSELALYSKNLRTIGSSSLTNDDILECLDDDHWLVSKSENEWLIQLYQFLEARKFEEESLFLKNLVKVWSDKDQASILSNAGKSPIYFERDEETRRAIKEAPEWLRKIVPTVFLDHSFLKSISDQEEAVKIMEWMTENLNVHLFSLINYCRGITNGLTEKHDGLSPKKIAAATSFLVTHVLVRHADEYFEWNNIPVVLNNGELVVLSFSGEDIIVPERYDRSSGWQHIWETEQDRQHFNVLSNHYDIDTVEYLLSKCHRIKKFPKPNRIEKIQENELSVGNVYEKTCISKCRQRSTLPKRISNWRPPSILNPEIIENKKASNSLVAYLSSRNVGNYKNADVTYYYYGEKVVRLESEFHLRLKNCKWLPTQKGFVRPLQAFLPKKEIKEILGDTVPYFQGELSEENLELLGIKSELTIDELLETLTAYCSETNVSKEMVYRIYSALDTRTRFDSSDKIVGSFTDNELIFVPERKDVGNWHSLQQVIWEDSVNVLGDDFTYLENHYPKLKEFFMDTLGVKEKADPESFAHRWLKLQYETIKDSKEVQANIEYIYRTLLPIAKAKHDEKPVWWQSFVRDALIFTQGGEFLDASEIVVPDDGELKKIFSFEGSEVAFAWRPEKDSFSQWAPFYKAFNISNISNVVTTELVQDAESEVGERNIFLTDSTILMLSSWLREKDNKSMTANDGCVLPTV